MANDEATLYEVRDGAAWITLNRPEVRNAISAQLVAELDHHLEQAFADDQVRTVVLTGAGKGFCAGADLKNPPGRATADGRVVPYPDLLMRMWNGPKPVIGMINGAAYAGGLGMVAACDIVVTDEDAGFAFSEVKIGVIPAIIAVVCLRKLGEHHGMKLFLTGERFTGKQAVTFGLAHRAVPADQLEAAVQEEIDLIRLAGPNAVAEAKKLVRQVPHVSMAEGFELTQKWSRDMFQTEEAAEGMAAFREKRPPAWVSESE